MWGKTLRENSRPTIASTALGVVFLALGTIAVLWLVLPVWQHQNLNDDSFITLTYAKNLLAGRGFVFNHPPATLGTTSPLFVFVTAGLAALTRLTVVQAAIIASALAWMATGWTVFALLRHQRWSPAEAGLVALIVMSVGYAWIALVGMEIWQFEFLLVLTILLAQKRYGFWAGISVGLLFLTRGEGALLAPIIGLYLWWKTKKFPIRFVGGGTLVGVAWAWYALATFGTVLPNTLAAKQAQSALPTGRYFIERIVTELIPGYLQSFSLAHTWFLNAYLLLVLIGLGFVLTRRPSTISLLLVWVMIYLGGYTILNPQPYYWYMLHIVFVMEVLTGAGIVALRRSVRQLQPGAGKIAVSIAAIAVVFAGFFAPANLLLRDSRTFTGDARADSYRAVAAWLAENTAPEDSVAFIEIGYLGYFTENRIIDLAGLIDPEVTLHLVTDGFSWAYWHYQPDYYIFAPEFNWALGDIEPDLARNYTPVAEITRKTFDVPLVIYKKDESQ